MSIYSDGLAALQRCGVHGGTLTHAEMRNLLACIRARTPEATNVRSALATGATAASTCAAAIVTGKNAVITANAGVAVQTAILAGIGGDSATAGAAIDALMATLMTANGVLTTAGTTMGTAGTALTTARTAVTADDLVVNLVMDGA